MKLTHRAGAAANDGKRGKMLLKAVQRASQPPAKKIVRILAAGCVMQFALGAVQAWSFSRIPRSKTQGWTVSQATLTFELAILRLGFPAAGFFRRLRAWS